ncbi:hypothetical protein BC939DRAFT_489410 [Gamsiella multidivaricata]|uniref:uncharacterized protein n=1 Tax=Gamsiella multidivaricata TaxID=101098 RepID=UPI00221F77F2|nr:uncharacterized protein BC939DRAFT_489410 [Gamsiella multidivaricata]KAG0350409.1 hypothetical protein BGZ54_003835 [Gamsiella multidivaricata]KAI7831156.1 hypothetical protein BC939DRAFT_489410 [Gamsiella multidivaricata]
MKVASILTLAAAVCAIPVNAKPAKAPAPNDPCALMAKQAEASKPALTYEAVKGCFNAHKFRPDVAEKVLTSVENLLGNFYAFVDQAKVDSSNVPGSPFKTPKVDLMKELAKLRKKKDWKNDYEFQMALSYLTFSLNDGHLSYRNSCYQTASFYQPLTLYAPVVDGKQSARVFFVDTTTTTKGLPKDPASLTDCAVLTIDGKPALQAIQEFTDRTSAISKDPGVRLNDALASTSWSEEWYSSPGGFASRWELPQKASMDYTIQCGTGKVQRLTVPWTIRPSDEFETGFVKDVKSYWDVQCYALDDSKKNEKKTSRNVRNGSPRRGDVRVSENGIESEIVAPATAIFRKRGKISKAQDGPKNGKGGEGPKTITQAKLVHTSYTTAFYRLTSSQLSDTCVAVIATEDATHFDFDTEDYTDVIKGFQKLQDQGCKKLILDMTNNGGGSVDFAYFINQLLFPDAKPYFVQDIRDNQLAQAAAKQAVKHKHTDSIFDARNFNSMATRKPFKDASMFTKGVNQKRGGSTATYTQRNFFPHSWPFLPLAKGKQLKFKAENMAIVSNGFCGSACTMIATRFALTQSVKTYAIGGLAKRPLSYFSFPGGFVMENGQIINDLDNINMKNTKASPTWLPIVGTIKVAVGEIYAFENSTVPLEYDAKHFPANVHLDQDPVSARHPDQVWVKIAKDFGKKK